MALRRHTVAQRQHDAQQQCHGQGHGDALAKLHPQGQCADRRDEQQAAHRMA
jgi:hypothetical protein